MSGACAAVADLVERLGDFGERPALGLRGEFGLRWISYRTLRDQAWAVAALLADAGVKRGDHILIWSANGPEWVACLLGALLRGIVVVSVDDDASMEVVTQVMRETSPRYVFHRTGHDVSHLDVPALRIECLPAPVAGARIAVELSEADPAVIIYTSGSTAAPRGVILTHGNLDAQTRRFRRWRWLLRLAPMRQLVIAPLSHVQGLVLGAFIPLTIGLSVVFVRSVHSAHLLRTLRANRIVLLAAVPRVLTTLKQALEAMPYRTGTLGERLRHERRGWMRRHLLFTACNRAVGWRFWVILVGGATVGLDDEQFWRDTGRFVIQGYGLTETTAIVALNGPFSRRVGSIGKPLQHLSVRVSEDGELLVRGATVSRGYVPGAGPAESALVGGYLPTGDVVRVAGGRMYFVGRKKELIVTSEGHNVAPASVEPALARVAGVIDAVVIARRGGGSEEVHAVLRLEPGIDAAAVVRAANATLEPYQRIRSWTVWTDGDFPRTPLLKPQRHEIERRVAGSIPGASLAAGEIPASADAALALESIAAEPDRRTRVQLLARYLADARHLSAAESATALATDLGLSSLDYVELLGTLERLAGADVDRAWLPDAPTIGDVHSVMHAGAPRPGRSPLPTRQPRWAESPLAGGVRAVVRPAAVALWQALRGRCIAHWQVAPASLRPPFILAVAPHRHWLDAFIVAGALPDRLARRLLVVTNRDFGEYFDPRRHAPWRERLTIGLGYYLSLPMTFPFTILRGFGPTREGLFDTLRWVDRGYCPLVFPKGILVGPTDPARHDAGAALMAAEAGVPIVPVWIRGNESCGWRPRRRGRGSDVLIGEPVSVQPDAAHGEVERTVEARWADLARQA